MINVPQVINPKQPISTNTIIIIWPMRLYSLAMSTTVSPVTQTAEHAVKSEVRKSPDLPVEWENGSDSKIAPTIISAMNPNAMEKRFFTARTNLSP